MSNQQQFVKNTNKPDANSELWTIADEWKISGTTGLPYTAAENVFRTANDHEFYDAIVSQLKGEIKESLDIGLGFYFVASYSQNGKALLYAYPPNRKEDADKKASYNNGSVPAAATGGGQQQQQQSATSSPQQKITQSPKVTTTSTYSAPSTVQTKASQTIEVPYDIVKVEWDNAMEIEQVEATGRFVLPVKHTGVQNWGYEDKKTGNNVFWYGRIKLVRIQEEEG